MQRLLVVGGGAWGTALAASARRAGRDVVLWAREREVVEAINRTHENPLFLPGIRLDPAICATEALDEPADAILLVVPSQHLRSVAERLDARGPVLLCAKGIEQTTLRLMTEVAAEAMPRARLAVLSGPTFAAEVARGLPTAVTLAANDLSLGKAFIAALGTRTFRPYLSDDPIGAEIGGAVKNVLAIACGVVAGRKLGDNARAALITRGLAEMVRLAVAKGGRAETLMGLSVSETSSSPAPPSSRAISRSASRSARASASPTSSPPAARSPRGGQRRGGDGARRATRRRDADHRRRRRHPPSRRRNRSDHRVAAFAPVPERVNEHATAKYCGGSLIRCDFW